MSEPKPLTKNEIDIICDSAHWIVSHPEAYGGDEVDIVRAAHIAFRWEATVRDRERRMAEMMRAINLLDARFVKLEDQLCNETAKVADLERRLEEVQAALGTMVGIYAEFENLPDAVSQLVAYQKDLSEQLAVARERIAELQDALSNILLDMDRAKAEGRQYTPLPAIDKRTMRGRIVKIERVSPPDVDKEG